MKSAPSPFLAAYLKGNSRLTKAHEMGRKAHLKKDEPQMSLALAEHYIEYTELAKNEVLVYLLARPALEPMNAEAVNEIFGPTIAAINEEIRSVDRLDFGDPDTDPFLSPLALEAMDTIMDYTAKSLQSALKTKPAARLRLSKNGAKSTPPRPRLH
jgi:hypothetical protein